MPNRAQQKKTRPGQSGAYHHGDLRRSLIQAALTLAAEGRDWNFSLREVARRAGVSHNAPYNHFTHKEELMSAAAVAGHELLRGEVAAAITKVRDPKKALVRMGVAYVKFGRANPALYNLMFSAAHSGQDWRPEAVIEAGVAMMEMLEEILRRGAKSGVFAASLARKAELQKASITAWAVVHGLTMLVIDGLAELKGISVDQTVRKLGEIVLRGLVPKEAKRAEPIL
jgi:AcrR family transcriptional regulator